MRLSYAFGADPRTGKLAPAKAPAWAGLHGTFRAADGAVLYETELDYRPRPLDGDAAGRGPGGDRHRRDLRHADRARPAATHLLGIRGIGSFTLTADGAGAV